ncbi:hypothetical protein [Pseudomonas sp. PDM20]|uniref:hypothetical protein n=1 Tax=Pseudomonas sp. PDM20 TaxID=2769254 RepID=UPI0017857A12|nr:hypothetical protein [Pseudomonas sp. PDM20]MBD9681436.1 hypothetical protein [Pseudomonas sp. PDM20]
MEKILIAGSGIAQTAILAVLCFSLLNQHQQQSYDRVVKRIDNLLTYTEQRQNNFAISVDDRLIALEQNLKVLEARQEAWRSHE